MSDMTRVALGVIWLLRFLPLAGLAPVGEAFGMVLYALWRERRRVALTNLRLCFPQWSERERRRVARRHFRAFGRSFIERGILWWSSKERIQRVVQVEDICHWEAVRDKPVVWLAPHFIGLDMGGIRLATEFRCCSLYSRQKNAAYDAILLHGRTRFGTSTLYSRQEGIRPVVKAIRDGLPFYYLPDMDLGARDSIFVPFFEVPAATVAALSRICRMTGAVVVPCVTRQLPGGRGYVARFYPAWSDFPGADLQGDTRRMNAFIEERVREVPEQYFWLHKRFKTRPPGEGGFY